MGDSKSPPSEFDERSLDVLLHVSFPVFSEVFAVDAFLFHLRLGLLLEQDDVVGKLSDCSLATTCVTCVLGGVTRHRWSVLWHGAEPGEFETLHV